MKPALKLGIAGAAGIAIALAIKNISDKSEEIAEQTKLTLLEANKKNIDIIEIPAQTLASNGNFHDTTIYSFEAKVGKLYYILTSFFGSAAGTGIVGIACGINQIRMPQPVGYDFGVSLPAVIEAKENQVIYIRALYHGALKIAAGKITIIER